MSNVPLFNWRPDERQLVEITPFPQDRRIGKVRDVAATYTAKRTDKARAHYQRQAIDAMRGQLIKAGVDQGSADAEVARFWSRVQVEVARLSSARQAR